MSQKSRPHMVDSILPSEWKLDTDMSDYLSKLGNNSLPSEAFKLKMMQDKCLYVNFFIHLTVPQRFTCPSYFSLIFLYKTQNYQKIRY